LRIEFSDARFGPDRGGCRPTEGGTAAARSKTLDHEIAMKLLSAFAMALRVRAAGFSGWLLTSQQEKRS
jgi:hypothetical protein